MISPEIRDKAKRCLQELTRHWVIEYPPSRPQSIDDLFAVLEAVLAEPVPQIAYPEEGE